MNRKEILEKAVKALELAADHGAFGETVGTSDWQDTCFYAYIDLRNELRSEP